MIPVSVVDNFFNDPDTVRAFALAQEFDYPRAGYPGYRTKHLFELDTNLYESINNKILLLFFDPNRDNLQVTVESQFQLIPEKFEEGWVHQDIDINQRDFAGVIYLTPDAPVDAGTSIYSKVDDINSDDYAWRNKFYMQESVEDMSAYRKVRDSHNEKFIKTLDIGNVYNRMVIYPTNEFHKESRFFGDTNDNSRLTLCFFISIKTFNNTLFPIERSNSITQVR